MGQSVFSWIVIFETYVDEKTVEHYVCTWDELLEQLPSEQEVVAIIRTGLKW
jgi:hypothetical protein